MKDLAARLEKLRKDAAECASVRDSATDPKKRELSTKLAEHYQVLATEVERAMKIFGDSASTFLGRKTQEPFPEEERAREANHVPAKPVRQIESLMSALGRNAKNSA